jgi:hypothetical protein
MTEEMEKKLRLFILDTLVAHSGKQLLPDLIGQLTSELLGRVIDVVACDNEIR